MHLNLKQFVQEATKQNAGLLVACLPISPDEGLYWPPLSILPESRHLHHISFSSQSGVSFKRKMCKCMLSNQRRILTWLNGDFTCILHISVSALSLLLGCKSRARFMVPTGYEFFPKLWCWYLLLAQILQLQIPDWGDTARSKMRCGWWPMPWQPKAAAWPQENRYTCQLKDHLHKHPDNPPAPQLP